jgi:hypothetical protein
VYRTADRARSHGSQLLASVAEPVKTYRYATATSRNVCVSARVSGRSSSVGALLGWAPSPRRHYFGGSSFVGVGFGAESNPVRPLVMCTIRMSGMRAFVGPGCSVLDAGTVPGACVGVSFGGVSLGVADGMATLLAAVKV